MDDQIVDRAVKFLVNVYAEGKLDLIDEIMHPQYAPAVSVKDLIQFESTDLGAGFDKLKQRVMSAKVGLANIEFDILQTSRQGNSVFVYYRQKALHVGEYLGLPPTNKRFSVTGVHIFEFKDSKIWRINLVIDHYKMLRDIGKELFETAHQDEIDQYLKALRKLSITQ